MQPKDIPEVIDIERDSFSMTWPANSYRRELEQNRMARYIVLRYEAEPGGPPSPPRPTGARLPFPFSLLPLPADRQAPDPNDLPVVGYGGLWLMVDEAHVTSVAVRPGFRGKGLGELLMLALFDIATRLGARWVTLEVRVSNAVARRLYAKMGFREAGTRPRYYTDNNEDAVVMWSEELRSASFKERYARLKAELNGKLRWTVAL
jgi:ribosomal-protein-alanine N-acetyltransferase